MRVGGGRGSEMLWVAHCGFFLCPAVSQSRGAHNQHKCFSCSSCRTPSRSEPPPRLCPSNAAEVVAANSLNSEAVMVMIYLLSLCNPNIHTHTDTHQPTTPCALLIRFPHQPAAATALSLLWDPKFPPSRTLGL